ncbi:hypothetical protein M3Y96_00692100 [Aphelenchoides besseyi]|nr:hypothetical protein M3Y96_00692100 [Aphelenchoides besseyi]
MAEELETNCRISNDVLYTIEQVGDIKTWVQVVGVQNPTNKLNVLKVLTHSMDVTNSLTPIDGNQIYVQFKDAKEASKLIESKNLLVPMIQTEDLIVRTEAMMHQPVHLKNKPSYLEGQYVKKFFGLDRNGKLAFTEKFASLFDMLFDTKSPMCIDGVDE